VVVEAAPTAGVGVDVGAGTAVAVGALVTITVVTAFAKAVWPSLVAWALSFAANPVLSVFFRKVFNEVAPVLAADSLPALT